MKSERRHELKTNTLASGIGNLPVFWRLHGNKVLLGILAVLAIILFLRFQTRAAAEKQEQAAQAYAAALAGIRNLQSLPQSADPKLVAEQRGRLQEEVDRAITQVLDDANSDAMRADALAARGDLHWTLAHLPGSRSAGTQPTGKSAAGGTESLEKAQKAYESVTRTAGAKPLAVATAWLGLAAIAEERQQWDVAKTAYDSLIKDPAAAQPFKDEAKIRLDDLTKIQKPILLGKPATVPSAATEPVDMGPVGPPAPTTAATAPAAVTRPQTIPVTQPATTQSAKP
jgi:type II secretory pathway pseudopilin PulG